MLAENMSLSKNTVTKCKDFRTEILGETKKTAWDKLPLGKQLQCCSECPLRPYDEVSCSFRWGRIQDIASLKLGTYTVLRWVFSGKGPSHEFKFHPYLGANPISDIIYETIKFIKNCEHIDPQTRPEEFREDLQEIYALGPFEPTNMDFSTMEGKVNIIISYCLLDRDLEKPLKTKDIKQILPGIEALLALKYEYLASQEKWNSARPHVILAMLLWRQYLKMLKVSNKAEFDFYFSL